MDKTVTVVGAGLAGCEACWQLAENDIRVKLLEMKPEMMSPAHHSEHFAELVCSNSLRSDNVFNAVGLLKEEMRMLGSLIIRCADRNKVAAGSALAVDRTGFSSDVTQCIRSHPLIEVITGEVTRIPDGIVIIATGPLTSDLLCDSIAGLLPDNKFLYFFDAAAPIVAYDGIDMSNAFYASRYGKGTPDYINCPLSKDEYRLFRKELADASEALLSGFEDASVFEGCMPVEVMARRGEDTLRYGPLKPVGLIDPRTGRAPYAVVQLRRDNQKGTLYNLVGFQTHLTFKEQKRVFSLIPALKDAEFIRYGVMHRNTYIDSPRLLDRHYKLKAIPRIRFAGQITGVEGYVESAASGLLCGLQTAREIRGEEPYRLSSDTAIGALAGYISNTTIQDFQPMNVNFGIMEPLTFRVKGKRGKNEAIAKRSLTVLGDLLKTRRKE
ncbi:MAG: methylenetetrahydrofolate--tRNA-(uracil(54)-C(5))-methyltransferase (FADH(2)-oxidizing) TrmFO [Clostridiales bacterium]|nr:methylenetetrahydrofolate--tRNA-(uracil(54)-C(5))-methyltransferase (FADH(2)-oxidizing) TrmFO [Clostridiales bacterium]